MADKSMLAFTTVAGGQKQSSTIKVTSSAAPVPFTVAVSVQTSGAWLSCDTVSGSTPKTVTITSDPTTLTAGVYQGTVTITASNTVTIPVMFTVQASPMVSAGAANLAFTYFSGGSAPPAQMVLISGSTGGFTATAASDTGNWLSVTPTSGTAGTNISVAVDPTGIAGGMHTGTVTIAGTNGLPGQEVIDVSLSVTAPLPSVFSVLNGASYEGSPIAPGDVITLFEQYRIGHPRHGAAGCEGQPRHRSGRRAGVGEWSSGADDLCVSDAGLGSGALRSGELVWDPSQNGRGGSEVSEPDLQHREPAGRGDPAGDLHAESVRDRGGRIQRRFQRERAEQPGVKGSTVVFFLTGVGQTNPPGKTGTINSTPNMNQMPVAPITVTIRGQSTTYS
jgi:hypothetical protein